MIGIVGDDVALLKQALIFTCTMQAVSQILEFKDGSTMTVLATAVLLTYGAKVTLTLLKASKAEAHSAMGKPIYGVLCFVAETTVSFGINFQANLIGTYFGSLFSHNTPPLFILFGAFNALVLVWVLGVAVGVISIE